MIIHVPEQDLSDEMNTLVIKRFVKLCGKAGLVKELLDILDDANIDYAITYEEGEQRI
jgi:hypothetical protein